MNTDNYKKRNLIVNSSAVFLVVFIFYYLSDLLIGNQFDLLMATMVSILMGVIYFTMHHLLNRYAKKRHRNVAVREFL